MATTPYPGSWDIQQSSVMGRLPNSRDGALDAYASTKSTSGGWLAIYRSFLSFNLNLLPEHTSITSAKLIVFPKYVMNDTLDSYAYIGLYPSLQASSTDLTFDDIEHCGDAITNPTEIALTTIEDFTQGVSGQLEFNSNGLNLMNHNNQPLFAVCLRDGHDADDQEIFNNSGSFWRSSGLVVYGTDSGLPDMRPYLEVTYTVPDPEPEVTVAGNVGLLQAFIDSLQKKSMQNAYNAHVKKILGFFETGSFTAALNQLGALFTKTTEDATQGQLTQTQVTDVQHIITETQDLITDAAQNDVEDVPLMTQIASPYPPESSDWEGDLYGDGTPDWCGSTIGGCGCAITSLSMLGGRYGIKTGYDGTAVNPRNMNAWLKANNGYTAINTVRWYYSLQYLSQQLGFSTLQLDSLNSTDMTAITQSVGAGQPGIAFKKSKGHYLVLTDVLASGGFAVKDPFWYLTETTNDVKDVANHVQNYGDTVDQVSLYSHSNVPRPFPRWVEIQLGSPAELLVTDSQGRRTGYDVSTGQIINEIPGSTYTQAAGPATADTLAAGVHLPKVLAISAPTDDLYTLSVIGTGDGPYTLSVDTGGGYDASEINHTVAATAPQQIDTYIIDVPVRHSSTRAVDRLRALADGKEGEQPTVASQLRAIADRLATKNFAPTTAAAVAALY